MYVDVQQVAAHASCASQPLFSRAVQPAQRKVPLIERRKRKMPTALNLEQIPQFRRRNPKHACVLTAPPTCVRVAQAPAGPHHTLHRCVDVRTKEVFFHPEYTGPAGEEDMHVIKWPKVIELASPVAHSGSETLRRAGYISPDTADTNMEDYLAVTPGSVYHEKCGQQQQHQLKKKGGGMTLTLVERRKRKAPAPLQLDIIPPFKRRNADQICVLEAPATHLRLHAVQAGPHHVMHQCIDACTEEIFFMPEYVGPSGQQDAHKVPWPQIINPAPKPVEHQQDCTFAETLDRTVKSVGDESNPEATSAKAQVLLEPSALSISSSAPASLPSPLADGTEATTSTRGPESASSTATTLTCASTVTCVSMSTTFTKSTSMRNTSSTRIHILPTGPIAAECCPVMVGADGGKGQVETRCNATSDGVVVTNLNSVGAIVEVSHGRIWCSPGTPCDVVAATASVVPHAIKVN